MNDQYSYRLGTHIKQCCTGSWHYMEDLFHNLQQESLARQAPKDSVVPTRHHSVIGRLTQAGQSQQSGVQVRGT